MVVHLLHGVRRQDDQVVASPPSAALHGLEQSPCEGWIVPRPGAAALAVDHQAGSPLAIVVAQALGHERDAGLDDES